MRKEELISLTKSLISLNSLKGHEEDLKTLKREYRRLIAFEGESFYEKQLVDEFISLFEELAKKDPTLTRGALEEKKAIIEQMKALVSKPGIKNLSKEMNELLDNFKHAGKCDKETDDALWAEMKALQDEAHKKLNDHFNEVRRSFEEKKAKKEAIIEEASKVLEMENIKDATLRMNQLMDEWKAVGFAGKEVDEELWNKFKELKHKFNEKRSEHFEHMKDVYEDRVNQKKALIKEMKKLTADAYFNEEELKQIKAFRDKWSKIGFAGKDNEDQLWEEFNAAIKQYFDEKKFYTF